MKLTLQSCIDRGRGGGCKLKMSFVASKSTQASTLCNKSDKDAVNHKGQADAIISIFPAIVVKHCSNTSQLSLVRNTMYGSVSLLLKGFGHWDGSILQVLKMRDLRCLQRRPLN